MRRNITSFLFILLLLAAPLYAQRSGDQGVGLMIGNPSGLSYKMWLNEDVGLDAAVGVAQGEFDVHATLLWHNFTWSKNSDQQILKDINSNGDFPFYFGFGPRALFDHKTEFGIRFPVGLAFLPHNSVWEFFGEVAPVVRLTPDTGVDGDFAVGLRYYFPAVRARSE